MHAYCTAVAFSLCGSMERPLRRRAAPRTWQNRGGERCCELLCNMACLHAAWAQLQGWSARLWPSYHAPAQLTLNLCNAGCW